MAASQSHHSPSPRFRSSPTRSRVTSVTVLLALAAAALLAGCGSAAEKRYAVGGAGSHAGAADQTEAQSPESQAIPGTPGGSGASGTASTDLSTIASSQADRFLIRNATVTVESKDVIKSSRELISSVVAARGYVAELHESLDNLGSRSVEVKVRVPAQAFDQSMSGLESLGKILEKAVTAEDVTEEFVDSQARLRNLNKEEARLIDILGRTGRLSDTLQVEQELSRVRGETEQIEGRLRYLSHRVDFSTIDVTFQETAHPLTTTPPESYSSGKIASDAVRSLVGFLQNLWTVVLWILVWIVVWGPVAVIIWLVQNRRKAKGET